MRRWTLHPALIEPSFEVLYLAMPDNNGHSFSRRALYNEMLHLLRACRHTCLRMAWDDFYQIMQCFPLTAISKSAGWKALFKQQISGYRQNGCYCKWYHEWAFWGEISCRLPFCIFERHAKIDRTNCSEDLEAPQRKQSAHAVSIVLIPLQDCHRSHFVEACLWAVDDLKGCQAQWACLVTSKQNQCWLLQQCILGFILSSFIASYRYLASPHCTLLMAKDRSHCTLEIVLRRTWLILLNLNRPAVRCPMDRPMIIVSCSWSLRPGTLGFCTRMTLLTLIT